jgi:glycosyltransferase involved in cell wall biosynthesis
LAAENIYKPIKNEKMLKAVMEKYKLPKKFVLYVGDVNYNKNIPSLIKAAALAKLPLVWVGNHALEIEKLDKTHPELRHLIDVNLESVLRLGFVPDEDLAVIYNLATVYCQPSFAEGFGLPVLEALACGTAVACSNTHSLPEIAGDAVEYFDPYDLDQMIKAITKAKFTPEKFDANRFSWEKTAHETLLVYKELF